MEPELFELTPERIEIALTVTRGREWRLTHELRYPTEDDWLAYDRALRPFIVDSDDIDRGIISSDESISAASDLWNALVQSVSGYFPNGLPEDWKDRIAPEHKAGVIVNLQTVAAEMPEENSETFYSEIADSETVRIAARRGIEYHGLLHRFRAPSQKERIAWSRLQSERIIVRGTKDGKDRILIPARMSRTIALYNELIQSVAGYALNGKPLTDDVKQIRFFMDAQHKCAVISGLMNPGVL